MKPLFIDIHSHINFPEYDADREAVLARMKEAGVATITVGVDRASSESAIAIAEKHENVFACIGLHPLDNPTEKFDMDAYRKLADHPKVVAIGECGLDYSRFRDRATGKKLPDEEIARMKAVQTEYFLAQIQLAHEVGKPLMLHIRDAYDDAYEILKQHIDAGQLQAHGNVHFFAGTKEIAEKFVALGFTLSFTGVITFARNYDEVIRTTPKEMLMCETDSPYVAPTPYRGKRNEPAWVIEVVKKMAEIRGESFEALQAQVMENASRVFKIF